MRFLRNAKHTLMPPKSILALVSFKSLRAFPTMVSPLCSRTGRLLNKFNFMIHLCRKKVWQVGCCPHIVVRPQAFNSLRTTTSDWLLPYVSLYSRTKRLKGKKQFHVFMWKSYLYIYTPITTINCACIRVELTSVRLINLSLQLTNR